MIAGLNRWARPVAVSAVLGASVAIARAALLEPVDLRVSRVDVPVGRCWERLIGLRLAHMSDMHVMGRGWRRRTIERAVSAVNSEDVDLVAITGDFIGKGAGARVALEILADLRADVPRFAVFGNHDHVYGTRYLGILAHGLSELGIAVLVNRAAPIGWCGSRVWVGGVDDGYSARDDLGPVLQAVEREPGPLILLTHYAEVAEALSPGQVQLSLAGHSHGGQVRVPLLGSLAHRTHARTRYGKGLFSVNGNPLHVSSGVGMSGIPLRFLNLPEVAILTFVAEADGQGRAAPSAIRAVARR